MSKLDESINQIKNMQKIVNDSAKESEDVKEGNCTLEEEQAEPDRVIYDAICNNTISLLTNKDVADAFVKIGKVFGEETSQELTVLIATCITQSAYSAIVFYDNLLKTQLEKDYDVYNHNINLCKSSIDGISAAMDVFKKRLSDVENKLKIEDLNKEINKSIK